MSQECLRFQRQGQVCTTLLPSSDVVNTTSGNHLRLTTHAHSGYTAPHSRFAADLENWSQMALGNGNIRDAVSVKVRMGTVKQGHGSFMMIGVSL